MKLALAIGLGVFVVGFSTGNSQEVDRTHLCGTPVPAPAGFEKDVGEAALAHAGALRPVLHVELSPATSGEVARAAAAMRSARRCEAKDEPRDTSRAVLNAENAAFERPSPRTNFFGRE